MRKETDIKLENFAKDHSQFIYAELHDKKTVT